jgi:hypothetical protein
MAAELEWRQMPVWIAAAIDREFGESQIERFDVFGLNQIERSRLRYNWRF